MGFCIYESHFLINDTVDDYISMFFANSVKADNNYCRWKNEIFSSFNNVFSIKPKNKLKTMNLKSYIKTMKKNIN